MSMDENSKKSFWEKDLKAQNVFLGGGAIVAALTLLGPVKDSFFTREEGRAIIERVDRVEDSVDDQAKQILNMKNQLDRKLDSTRREILDANEKSQDEIIERIDQVVDRVMDDYRSRDQGLNEQVKRLEDRVNKIEKSKVYRLNTIED